MLTNNNDFQPYERIITPDDAKALIKSTNYDNQRAVRPAHVQKLANAMRNGTFGQKSTLHFAVLEGYAFLIDGQHRLVAIEHSGIAQCFTIVMHECSNEDEVRALYSKFNRDLRRTPQDVLRAYGLHTQFGKRNDLFRGFFGSTGMVTGGFIPDITRLSLANREYYSLALQLQDDELRASIANSWIKEAVMFNDDIREGDYLNRSKLLRIGVFAVALVTYRFAGRVAQDFWREIALDDGLRRGDPRKTLLLFLLNNKANKFPDHLIARYVAVAWNHAYKGHDSTLLRVLHPNRPIQIEGTPHNSKQHMVYLDHARNLLHNPIPLDI